MLPSRSCIGVIAALGFLAQAPASDATTVLQMNLADLATRADKVYRAKVLSAKPSSLAVGGGQLPIVIYRVQVLEKFKGSFSQDTKDQDGSLVEVRMVASGKEVRAGNVRRVGLFRDVPQLKAGQEYVLFTTRPSAAGLSTTVGLAQGAFTIIGKAGEEQAVNALGNVGLARGLPQLNFAPNGAIPYAQLAEAIRAVVDGGR